MPSGIFWRRAPAKKSNLAARGGALLAPHLLANFAQAESVILGNALRACGCHYTADANAEAIPKHIFSDCNLTKNGRVDRTPRTHQENA